MKDPETVEIGMRRSVAETISHAVYPVAFDQKDELVLELLGKVDFDSVIVFCRTKVGADKVGRLLKKKTTRWLFSTPTARRPRGSGH